MIRTLLLGFFCLSGAPGFAQSACDALLQLDLPEGSRIEVDAQTGGAFETRDGGNITGLPDFCRAVITLPDAVSVEAWVPSTDWNGRFLGVGGGGYAGTISWDAMAGALRRGYATASTDTGHQGGTRNQMFAFTEQGTLDWSAIQNFASEALFEMTRIGKAAPETLYGRPPEFSYWAGCSTGGRQGLMQVQRTPEAYDGVLAGAPAINWPEFIAAELWPQIVMRSDAEAVLPACKAELVNAAALKACDDLDGVKDGVLHDPRQCDFDPVELVCGASQESDCACLTEGEARAVSRIWAGAETADGKNLWPGLTRTSDFNILAGEAPFPIALGQLQWTMVDPQADWTEIGVQDFEAYFRRSYAMFDDVLGTNDPDITKFADAGGKVIVWHGWTDQFIYPGGTLRYVEEARAALGQGADETLRLFMAPGVAHCQGGMGYTGFGHRIDEASGSQGLSQDPSHDIFEALVSWVEEDRSPERITAVRWSDDGDPERGLPLCNWPEKAVYDGENPVSEADSYRCEREPN